MMKSCIAVIICFILFLTVSIAHGVPTDIIVKVKGKGSKFIGSSVGGARITIKDLKTGATLAKGITTGSSGDTSLIMSIPRKEGEPISDTTAAKFSTTLDIDKPMYVEIKAYGPLQYPDSANSISITQWIFPGKDITKEDGLILEMPGFIVDILDMPKNIRLSDIRNSAAMPVRVKISMICGCPLIPRGMWNSEKFVMKAVLYKKEKLVRELPLRYGGKPSLFEVPLKINEAGTYKVTVYAFDPHNGNSGLDSVDLTVKE